MSWTSEFELPPQGPQVVPDDEPSAENGEATTSAEPDPEPVGQGFELSDIPEDGPLDPSVFDGLFTDLTEDEPEDYVQPDTFDLPTDTDETIVEDFDELLDEDFEDDEVNAFEDDDQVHLPEVDPEPSDSDEPEPAGFEDLQPEELEPEDLGSEEPEAEDLAPEDFEDGQFDTEDLAPDELEVDDHQPEELEPEELEPEELEPEGREPVDLELEELEADDLALEDLELEDPAEPEDVVAEDLHHDESVGLDSEGPLSDDPLSDDIPSEDFEDTDVTEPEPEEVDLRPEEPEFLAGPSAAPEPAEDKGGGFKLFDPAALPQVPAATPPAQIIEQPLPAVATSPPIALDDPYTENNGLQAEPYHELPAAVVVDQLNPTATAAPAKRRWPAFVTAIVVGGTLGIGGALLLTNVQNDGDQDTQSSQAPLVANEVTGQEATGTETSVAQDGGGDAEQSTSTSLLADGQLIAHAVGFVPGTTELTETSQATLQLVAASVAELPPEPTAITVRTFTQPTAEANRELSEQQAAALGDYLASLGVEFGGLSLRGVGAAPLAPAMPVENFVVARAPLRTTGITDAIAAIGPFEIGVDPNSLQLRPESIRALSQIGAALNSNDEGSVSLAGYSYDRPTAEANKAMAAAAVDAAREYLTTVHQIDPARLLVLAPGSLPYVLGPTQGGHVEIKRGRSVAVDVAVHSVEQPLVSFAAGSDALSGAAAEELGRVAGLLTEAQAQAVISVRSSGESSAEANLRLSDLQAEAISSFLADTGLAEGQVRVYGVGDIERLRSETATSEVTITVLP